MTAEEYRKALRLGKKVYRSCSVRGEAPFLPSLEQMLGKSPTLMQKSLGIVSIPLDQIAGTYHVGRQPTFTHGFLPLMDEKSEFAQKWMALCKAHLDEGIRDPIVAYEFMNRFYVLEGHKRVSVLKHFGAYSVHGTVTRLIPPPDDSVESHIYYEFLHFYEHTRINYLWFSKEGSFSKLCEAVGKQPDEDWSESDCAVFRSFHAAFSGAFYQKAGNRLSLTVGDAMLAYFSVFDYADSADKASSVIQGELTQLWDELVNYSTPDPIQLVLRPSTYRPLFPSLMSGKLRITFIHDKTADSSSWVYAHELGRRDLEAAFAGQVETVCMDNALDEQDADCAIEAAVQNGSDLIFTTSPRLLSASVRASVRYPKAKLLNCSLNTSHPSVRTYYARMYEAKFLMGVIAGSLTTDNRIGYIADYPIYGITANINAFALGAKMVDPNARIYLEWSKTVDGNSRERLADISYISDQDMITPDDAQSRHVGLYRSDGKVLTNSALSIWRWGRLYENIVRNYLQGGWKSDSIGAKAINYWWGMDSGVIDLICSRALPSGTVRLVELLRGSICTGIFHPFSDLLRTQDGTVLDYRHHAITPEELITMRWLSDNVVGALPAFEELLPEAQALVKIQGIYKP